MDGLLGFSSPYAGLLSEEDLAQARRQAQSNALLGLSSKLLEAGAPSRTPVGMGQALVKGIQGLQGDYQDTLKTAAMEKLNQQKIKQALDAQKRTAEAQRIAQGIFTPATPAQPAAMSGGAPYGMDKPAQPGGINQEVVQQLMAFPEGRAALQEIMGARKAMQPQMFSLKEGDIQYSIDPFSNAVTQIAAGTPKVVEPKLSASFAGAVDALGLPRKNASQYTDAERTLINKEMAKQRAESKMSVSVSMPSEGERKSATLASRMNFSVGQMMDAVGKDPSAAKPDTIAEAARFLSQSDWLPNKLNSEQRQIVEAAQEDILDAALTLGTGAAYTREQLAGYKKAYFPQIGDTDATVRTKQARLQNLLETAQLAAGRAAKDIPSPLPQPSIADISLSDLLAERQRRARK